MTNYNERLDEILCDTLNGEGVYREYSGKVKAAGQDEAKQAIASLTKELVEEAKPPKTDDDAYADGWNDAIDQFEQNLLKALDEK